MSKGMLKLTRRITCGLRETLQCGTAFLATMRYAIVVIGLASHAGILARNNFTTDLLTKRSVLREYDAIISIREVACHTFKDLQCAQAPRLRNESRCTMSACGEHIQGRIIHLRPGGSPCLRGRGLACATAVALRVGHDGTATTCGTSVQYIKVPCKLEIDIPEQIQL